VNEPAAAVKPEVSSEASTQEGDDDSKTELAEDEAGKRYVPEKRFDKVYGKLKQTERELQALKSQSAQPRVGLPSAQQPNNPIDKTSALETELLFSTMPQFNPESDEYSEELDSLGAELYKANPGITKVEAARRALLTAKKLAGKVAEVKQEARTVKSLQSDQGITNRVISREAGAVDPGKMSLDELEAHLRKTGQWAN
jgi:hypothetical protein